jgi:predicted transposase YbfD/YdcC
VKEMGILPSLQAAMKEVEQGTKHDGYWYSIHDALIILLCGLLCRQETISEIHEWTESKPTKRFFEEEFGIKKIPSRAQFYNLLGCVDAGKFNYHFTKWVRKLLPGALTGKTVAIDGKTICSTDKLAEDGSVLHIASAIVSDYGLVIGSHECGTKTGEITAFRELIDMLEITGAVVVADALHCNQKSAEAVVEAGADYLFVIKDNVPKIKADIELYIREEPAKQHTTVEKNGGRIEKRTAYASCDVEWLDGREHFKGLSCIGAIRRQFEKNGKTSDEWHYYISSKALSAEELLLHARMEWGVEAMHWLLDVHFSEDKTRVWDMNLQKTLNIMRKTVLNMVRVFKTEKCPKSSLVGILRRNLFDFGVLSSFLSFFRGNVN